MSYNFYKKIRAFSLIETLIAVSILMIAIAGPLSLVQAGLFSSIHQRNQVTATYLAQEAIEYVKNVRDSNSYTQYIDPNIPAVDWLTGPDGITSLLTTCSVGCYIDPHGMLNIATGNKFVQSVAGVQNLRQATSSTGAFSYSYDLTGAITPYERIVVITPVPSTDPASDEVIVRVTIKWKDNALDRSYTVSTNMYNYEVGDANDPGVTGSGVPSNGAVLGYMYSGGPKVVSYPPPVYVYDYTRDSHNVCPDDNTTVVPIYNTPGVQYFHAEATPQYYVSSPLNDCGMSNIVITQDEYTVTVNPFGTVLTGKGTYSPWNTDGNWRNDEATGVIVNAIATAPRPTVGLSGSATINSGDNTTLTWGSTDATSCTASWTGSTATADSQSVSPAVTTTYTITCMDSNGRISLPDSATVTVRPVAVPPTLTLIATPASINSGGGSTLYWTSTDTTRCDASDGWSGQKALSNPTTGTGERQTGITATTVYTITCTGSDSSTVSRSATVTVNGGGGGGGNCTSPVSIQLGTSGTFTAPCSGTLQLYMNDIPGPVDNLSSGFDDNGGGWPTIIRDSNGTSIWSNTVSATAASGVTGPTLVSGQTYSYSSNGSASCGSNGACQSTPDGTTQGWSVMCLVGSGYTCIAQGKFATSLVGIVSSSGSGTPPPTVSLTANPTSVSSGVDSTLSWTSTDATYCTATAGSWSGAKAISGSEIQSGLTATTVFTITCTGAGGTASDSKTVTVTSPSQNIIGHLDVDYCNLPCNLSDHFVVTMPIDANISGTQLFTNLSPSATYSGLSSVTLNPNTAGYIVTLGPVWATPATAYVGSLAGGTYTDPGMPANDGYNWQSAEGVIVTTGGGGGGAPTIGQMHFAPGCPIATAPITNASEHQIIPPEVTANYGSNCYLNEISINDSAPGYVIMPFPFGAYPIGSFLMWPSSSPSPITYPGATANFFGVPVQYLTVMTP